MYLLGGVLPPQGVCRASPALRRGVFAPTIEITCCWLVCPLNIPTLYRPFGCLQDAFEVLGSMCSALTLTQHKARKGTVDTFWDKAWARAIKCTNKYDMQEPMRPVRALWGSQGPEGPCKALKGFIRPLSGVSLRWA